MLMNYYYEGLIQGIVNIDKNYANNSFKYNTKLKFMKYILN